MNRKPAFLCLLALGAGLLAATTASATIINPRPDLFGPDDGTEIFTPRERVLTAEVFDLFGSAGFASWFGFFFAGDPSVLIPVFDPTDTGAPLEQRAIIDFNTGQVLDVDEGTVQSTFSGFGDIGFFIAVGEFEQIRYSVAALNVSGLDAFASFPALNVPEGYLLGFEVPEAIEPRTISFHVALGLTPAPEPATILLLATGFLFVGIGRKLSA